MFDTIDYLQTGNTRQKLAYQAISQLGIMNDLSEYHPVLCGTLPIGIDIAGSDLDMIMEVADFDGFEEKVNTLYGNKEGFLTNRLIIRGVPVLTANFIFEGFEFELFGQPQPVHQQYAYLHMIIEHALLQLHPDMREQVIKLKQQGYKTEPAFCTVLGIEGDPYEGLIQFGKSMGII
jgi:Domain of unknown function (DUF4269)